MDAKIRRPRGIDVADRKAASAGQAGARAYHRWRMQPTRQRLWVAWRMAFHAVEALELAEAFDNQIGDSRSAMLARADRTDIREIELKLGKAYRGN